MANEGQGSGAGLEAAAAAVGHARGMERVEPWKAPFCGDLDLRIGADGTWYYLKSPIGRPALVKLFASVLKREGERYYLVTPAEKCGIVVEDAPFLAVELAVERKGDGRVLHFRTNVDDWVTCGAEHPLGFAPQAQTEGLRPYLHVRGGLWARVTRALTYDLVALGEERELGGERMFGIASGASFFALAGAASLEDFA